MRRSDYTTSPVSCHSTASFPSNHQLALCGAWSAPRPTTQPAPIPPNATHAAPRGRPAEMRTPTGANYTVHAATRGDGVSVATVKRSQRRRTPDRHPDVRPALPVGRATGSVVGFDGIRGAHLAARIPPTTHARKRQHLARDGRCRRLKINPSEPGEERWMTTSHECPRALGLAANQLSAPYTSQFTRTRRRRARRLGRRSPPVGQPQARPS